MATLNDLMSEKMAGTVKAAQAGWSAGLYFKPFYLVAGIWYGTNAAGENVSYNDTDNAWSVYSEGTKTIYQFIYQDSLTGVYQETPIFYDSEADFLAAFPRTQFTHYQVCETAVVPA